MRNNYISRFDGDLRPHVETWFDVEVGKWPEFAAEYQQHELNIYQYEPFCEYKHPPRSGKYVNISEPGIRHGAHQSSWPPQDENFNIFFFGGSTTLNVGPDWTCIASYLQESLNANRDSRPVAVYNFGRGAYFSTLEKSLYFKILSEGFRPDLVIFLDGINDAFFHHGLPATHGVYHGAIEAMNAEISAISRNMFRAQPKWNHLSQFLNSLPLFRALTIFKKKQEGLTTTNLPPYTMVEVKNVYDRWSENKRQIEAVSAAHSVPAVFVWQPSPAYKYDLQYHMALPHHFSLHGHERADKVYEFFAERFPIDHAHSHILWLGDLQLNRQEPLYVDTVHYTAAFSRDIGNKIAGYLEEQELIDRPLPSGRQKE